MLNEISSSGRQLGVKICNFFIAPNTKTVKDLFDKIILD